MLLLLLLGMALLVVAVQLVFCFCAKTMWIRLLPLALAGVADLICWIVYAGGLFSDIYGGDFSAYIYGVIFAGIFGLEILAWAVYAVVKILQNKRK